MRNRIAAILLLFLLLGFLGQAPAGPVTAAGGDQPEDLAGSRLVVVEAVLDEQ